ncbi:gluconokinase, GntK/IdnK-type [Leucobacter sp. gxy201]|uniref:gluconokinase n=1 Tax=Leucobacter sp. gxy201 TaxID=2957200 RepID=UPI003DA05760
MPASTRIVVLGPSGSGKSTVGAALAERLGAEFIDADDLHPAENVAKMRAGAPLDDADRAPWLARVGSALAARERAVVACSALKRAYRDAIRRHAPDAAFVELAVDAAELDRRMRDRPGHFMPPALLRSQLAAFEPLADDEPGLRVAADEPVDAIIDTIRSWLTE